jgi:hypothetical protein
VFRDSVLEPADYRHTSGLEEALAAFIVSIRPAVEDAEVAVLSVTKSHDYPHAQSTTTRRRGKAAQLFSSTCKEKLIALVNPKLRKGNTFSSERAVKQREN